ncbi:MAG: S8 family serine peptidase [Gelidibacter sp.]
MTKITLTLFSILLSHFLFSQSLEMQTTSKLVVKFKSHERPNSQNIEASRRFENSSIDVLNKNNNITSIRLTGNKKQGATFVLDLDSNKSVEELIAVYKKSGLFEYVEPDFIGTGHGFQMTPNDAHYSRQWSHHNDGSFTLSHATVDADIDTDLAWEITQGDPNLIVAILDTGAKLNHPEFFGRIWINTKEVGDLSDTDGNGYIDDLNGGWDFVNNDNLPSDDHGHGTNVAGIALASGNNSIGYAGMNWNSKIMICKVLDKNNNGYYSWWAEAIYYAVDNGASVINLSAGGNGASTVLEEAVNYAYSKNVAVVVSTGNQNSTIQFPARYENAFAIGSTNSDDTRSVPFFWDVSSGSNYGAALDFVAPGHFIHGLSHISNTNYNTYWGGTSQGAPHVAGLISLLLSVNPNLTIDRIRAILEATSEDQVGDSDDTVGWDQYYGHGRINAFQALTSPLLGVEPFESSSAFTIYPNPANHNFKISKEVNVLDIYDLTGKRIKSFKGDFTPWDSFDIGDLKQSMYLLKIENKEGQRFTSKLIKQ